jgi:hypothetical protein
MDQHPHVGLVYGRSILHRSTERFGGRTASGAGARLVPGQRWVAERCRRASNDVAAPEAVVRRTVQDRVGGYRADLPYSADLEMWLRVASCSDVGVLDADQAVYRIHPSSMTRVEYDSRLVDLTERLRTFESFFAHEGRQLDRHERLRRRARLGVAKGALYLAARSYDRGTADPTSVAALLDLAREAFPGYRRLPRYWGLRARMSLGAATVARLGPAVSQLRDGAARVAGRG